MQILNERKTWKPSAQTGIRLALFPKNGLGDSKQVIHFNIFWPDFLTLVLVLERKLICLIRL